MITYPAGPILPHGAYHVLTGNQPMMAYRSPNDALVFHLMGGLAPIPAAHESGIIIKSMKGLIAPWMTRDQQGANQDGVTFNSAVYDPIEVDLGVLAFGRTPKARRKVTRDWIEAWDVRQQGELSVITEAGYWYAPVRWFKNPVDHLLGYQRRSQPFTWPARADDGFWRSVDSISQFPASGSLPGGQGTGFQRVTNIGDQDGWVNHVFYGPGTVEIANGAGSTTMIKFGPLLANQVALLRTEPRRRGVVDLTRVPPPQQQLDTWQQLIRNIVSFATNNNVPPLLRQFESLFGIMPPQAEMYALLNGRFTRPIPAKPAGMAQVESNIRVRITGGNSQTKLITYLTPRRRWPL